MFRAVRVIVSLPLILALGAAAEQAADPGDAIVVTASKLTPEQLRDRAAAYVALTGRATGERQVARWIEPVCPKVLNLEAKYAAIVEARVRAVANAARVPLARAPCNANIVVTFATEAARVVDAIAKRSPRSFLELAPPQRAALRTGNAPVRWWYATAVRGRDGRPGLSGAPLWTGGSEGGGSALPSVTTLASYGDTVVGAQSTRVLIAATVVVDIDRATGRSLASVADYVALVALAEVGTDAPPPGGSILGLFDNGEAVRLGDGDLGFLRALYAIPLDRSATKQRGRLMQVMLTPRDGTASPN